MKWRWTEQTRRTPWGAPPADALIDNLQRALGAGNVATLRQPDPDGPRCLIHVNTTTVLSKAMALLHGVRVVPVVDVPQGPLPNQQPGDVLVHLGRMNALLHVDEVSQVIHVQGGSRWRRIAYLLQRQGLTLGPLPRWVMDRAVVESLATEDALRPSPRYGQLLRAPLGGAAVLPSGAVTRLPPSPRRATGPDLWGALRGAGDRAGLVSEIYLQVWPIPAQRRFIGLNVEGWPQGVAAMARIARAGIRPAWWRLAETEAGLALWMRLEGDPDLIAGASGQIRALAHDLRCSLSDPEIIEAYDQATHPTPSPDPRPGDHHPAPAAKALCPLDQLAEIAAAAPEAELWSWGPEGGLIFWWTAPPMTDLRRWAEGGARVVIGDQIVAPGPWGALTEAALAALAELPDPDLPEGDALERPLRAGSPF